MIWQISNPWWIFIILGIFAGTSSGLLGIGGGVIMVPVLALLCCFGQKNAQGTALAVMVPMTLLGAWRYWQNPQVEMNAAVIILVVCGALVGTLIGTELASRLPSSTLRKIFALVMLIVAVKMFFSSPTPKNNHPDHNISDQQQKLSENNTDVTP